jgi:hypothetical protein
MDQTDALVEEPGILQCSKRSLGGYTESERLGVTLEKPL